MQTNLNAETVARALGGDVNGGQVLAPGPGHSAKDRSLSVKLDPNAPEGFLAHSFAGDDPIVCRDYVREKVGIPAFKPNGRRRASSGEIERALFEAMSGQRQDTLKGKIVATYPYTDADSVLLYQVVRYEPKTFSQRRPDGNGGWVEGKDALAGLNGRPVLYRWPELLKHPDATVFFCEGEKDADNVGALNLCATTIASGSWTDECAQALAGRDVVILEDNDGGKGRKRALTAAQVLHGIANSIRIVSLPDVKDVSDWIEADPTNNAAEKLASLCYDAQLWEPEPEAEAEAEAEPEQATADTVNAFTFLGSTHATPPKMLIKGLLPAEGIAITGGQSTAGKTFTEIHKAICLARPLPFFGYKIVERVGTAFIAAEGKASIPNRFAAGLAKHSITEKLPIAWINQLPDFSSADGIKLFIQQLKALSKKFEDDFSARLGQVTIDTVAACFAMKSEDDNAEAQKVCNILRIIGEEVGVLMCPVHHYGKNPESGLRGASAWRGTADIVQGVLADIDPLTGHTSNRELVGPKARDGEQGPISPFTLEFVRLGLDDDGEVYGSCCVVRIEGKSRFDKVATLSKSQRAICDAINEVLDGLGQIITPRAGMPPIKAAKVTDVRTEFDRRYVVDATDGGNTTDAKRKAFKRALDHLSRLTSVQAQRKEQIGYGSYEQLDHPLWPPSGWPNCCPVTAGCRWSAWPTPTPAGGATCHDKLPQHGPRTDGQDRTPL